MIRTRRCRTLALILIFSAASAAGPQAAEPPDTGYHEIETTYHSGSLKIAATLLIPDGTPPYPAAVIIQGAGPSSRENPWARQIGVLLARRGIAAYMPDKRGTGDSGGDWNTVGFDSLASDILAAVEYLRTRSEINPHAIGVVGLSQGGFYAPVVAAQSGAITYAAAVSASVMPFEETINHEMANTFTQEGLSGKPHDQAMDLQRAAFRYLRGEPWSAYDSLRQSALKGPGRAVIEGFPDTPDHWRWPWLRLVADFDPMDHWRRIRQPIFFAFGEDDEDDNVPVARSLERIHAILPASRVTLSTYANSGHALWDPERAKEGIGEVRGDFGDDLAQWILALVPRPSTRH